MVVGRVGGFRSFIVPLISFPQMYNLKLLPWWFVDVPITDFNSITSVFCKSEMLYGWLPPSSGLLVEFLVNKRYLAQKQVVAGPLNMLGSRGGLGTDECSFILSCLDLSFSPMLTWLHPQGIL